MPHAADPFEGLGANTLEVKIFEVSKRAGAERASEILWWLLLPAR